MSKLYTLLLTTLLSLVSLTTQAQFTVVLNVDNPDAVDVQVNYSSVAIEAGDNTLSVNSYTSLSIYTKTGYMLKKVWNEDTGTVYGENTSYISTSLYDSDADTKIYVSTQSLDEWRDCSMTLIVDDASKVNMQYNTYENVSFTNGTQTVKFNAAGELPITIGAANWGDELYAVILDGEVVEKQGSFYSVSPRNGSILEIKANFPDEDYPVHFDFADDNAKAFVKTVYVDGVPVTNYAEPDFTVKAGSKISFDVNTNEYKLNSFTVNGVSQSLYGTIVIKGETTFGFDVTKYDVVNATLFLDNVENVYVYSGENSYYGTQLTDLVSGENIIPLGGENPALTIMPKDDNKIVSVVSGETTYSPDYYGSYTIRGIVDGQRIEVTSQSEAEYRNKTMTVKIDDNTQAGLYRNNSWNSIYLANGEDNVVRYNETDDVPFKVEKTYYGKIYQVLLNGEVQTPVSDGLYYITPSDDCTLEVISAFPEVDVPVHFTYSSEEAKEAITSVTVDNVPVTNYNDDDFTLKAGQSVTVNFDYNSFKINSFSVNEVAQSVYSYATFTVTDETTVYLDATKYATYSVVVKVDDASNVSIYKGSAYSGTLITPDAEGVAKFDVPEKSPYITIKANEGCFITSVSDGTTEYTGYSGEYNITATDGMVLNVVSGKIVRDLNAVVDVDDISAASYGFYFQSQNYRSYDFGVNASGVNAIQFSSADNPFGISCYGAPGTVNVYKNSIAVAPLYVGGSSFELNLEEGDSVNVYVLGGHDALNVTFHSSLTDIADILTISTNKPITGWDGGLDILPGATLHFAAAGNAIQVTAGDNTVYTNADGTCDVLVEAAGEIALAKLTAIDNVEMQSQSAHTIYNAQGIMLRNGSVNNLPAGVYVIDGKKVIKK